MSILRSTRYNPGSVYKTAPPPGPHDEAFDPRPSMDEGGAGMYDDTKGFGQDRVYSDASGRYEDAYAEGSRAYPNEERYEGYGQQQQGTPQGYGQQHYGEQSYGHPQQGEQGYGYTDEPGSGGGGGQYMFNTPGPGYIDHPAEARSRDPGQTPTVNNYQSGQGVGWGGGDGGLRRPEGVQNHPGGSKRSP